jgi:hypothetical protein
VLMKRRLRLHKLIALQMMLLKQLAVWLRSAAGSEHQKKSS